MFHSNKLQFKFSSRQTSDAFFTTTLRGLTFILLSANGCIFTEQNLWPTTTVLELQLKNSILNGSCAVIAVNKISGATFVYDARYPPCSPTKSVK